jgi:DNA-directed RNA polymerase subunit RPC12/RpoP
MKAGRTILYILAGIIIVFAFLFILGAFSPDGSTSWLWVGIIGLLVGFLCIFWGSRLGAKAEKAAQNVTLQVDLPGNVSMDTIKCQSCGAPLSAEDIKMVSGAPMVSCPNCGTTYQLTEEPKW